MLHNAAVATDWSDLITDLGGIPGSRVVRESAPGYATMQDAIAVCQKHLGCELVDRTLVEEMSFPVWKSN